MAETQVFQHSSTVKAPIQAVWAFHEDPAALKKLTPFPIIMQVLRDERQSLTQGVLEFVLWFGPLGVRWTAMHEPGPTETSFIDRLVDGPLASWRHEHHLEPHPEGVRLVDTISYRHHTGIRGLVGRLLFNRLGLRGLFWYRHWRTRRESRAMAARMASGWTSSQG